MAKQQRAHGEGAGPSVAPFGEHEVDDLGGQFRLHFRQVANLVRANRRAAQFPVHDGQAQATGMSRRQTPSSGSILNKVR